MDFTREPIIESVITPKEGCKLVVRSSKGAGQEEYFVDAVEVVSFGSMFFFRSLERPKSFLVPVSDYEILEVREARMVLKNVGIDKSIKIGGGKENKKKESQKKQQKSKQKKKEKEVLEEEVKEETAEEEPKVEKKRERRRHYRRRREKSHEGEPNASEPELEESVKFAGDQKRTSEGKEATIQNTRPISPLLPPPDTLISETIEKYKGDEKFKEAFYTAKETLPEENDPHIDLPQYGTLDSPQEESTSSKSESVEENSNKEDSTQLL